MRQALLLLSFAACSSDDALPRYENHDHSVSVQQLEQWEIGEVRGAIQFSPRAAARARHRIVVRSAEKPREVREGVPATSDNLVSTTERVLKDTPRGTLVRGASIETSLPAAHFVLTFVPRGLTTRYRRDHVVLIGKQHVFHVTYTAPATEAMDADAFNSIVKSLEEEG
jgi:hypothetical protein